jgi:hypothetical protein
MSYPAWGTSPIKCAKRKCGWTGTEKDLKQVPHAKFKNATQSACPKCGCTAYYFAENGK